jgi:hypothetical protein
VDTVGSLVAVVPSPTNLPTNLQCEKTTKMMSEMVPKGANTQLAKALTNLESSLEMPFNMHVPCPQTEIFLRASKVDGRSHFSAV